MRHRLEDKRIASVLDTALRGLTGLAIFAAMLGAVWVAQWTGPDELAAVLSEARSPAPQPAAHGVATHASVASPAGRHAPVPALHTEGKPALSNLYSARSSRDPVYRTAVAPPTRAARVRTGATETKGHL